MDVELVDAFHPEMRKQKRWLEYIMESHAYGFREFLKEWWKYFKISFNIGRGGRHVYLLEDNRKLLIEALEGLQNKPHPSTARPDEVEWREAQMTWLKFELAGNGEVAVEMMKAGTKNGSETIGRHQDNT